MISNSNRIQVQPENGETEMLVLIALAIAGFESAPRGLDLDDRHDTAQKLTPEDIGDLDIINGVGRHSELVMVGDVFGRDCSLHAAVIKGSRGVIEINRDVYEGDVQDLFLRAEEILTELVPMNGYGGLLANVEHVVVELN